MSVRLSDVLIEKEPIGLAEEFAEIDGKYLVELETEEQGSIGDLIYFGMPLPIEEIAEIKAKVSSSESREGGYLVKAEVLAVDSKLKGPTLKELGGDGTSGQASAGPLWAKGLKQTNGTYAFLVNSAGGLLTADQLEGIAKVARKNAGVVKLTHAQRIVVLATADGMDKIEEELKALGLRVGVLHHGVRNIRACCGSLCKWCSGVDAIGAAGEIDKLLFGRETNFDVKVAISDCMRNCSESFCADIGVLGAEGSYKLLIGGRGSQVPFRAIQLANGIKPAQLADTVVKVVDWYIQKAEPKERLWKTLERLGAPSASKQEIKVSAIDAIGDGIDEVARLKSHLARAAGAAIARQDLGLELSFPAR